MNCATRHPVDPRHWRQHDRQINLWSKELRIIAKCREHLLAPLRVPDIGNILDPGLLKDEVKQSRLIELCHLLEGVIPKLLVVIRVKVHMIPREAVASRVIQPDVEALVCHEKRH